MANVKTFVRGIIIKLLIAGLGFLSGPLNAATISHSITLSQFTNAKDFLFDPALGSLTSVNLILAFELDAIAQYSGDAAAQHNSSYLNALNVESYIQGSVTAPDTTNRFLESFHIYAQAPIIGNERYAEATLHWFASGIETPDPTAFILQLTDDRVYFGGWATAYGVPFSAYGNYYSPTASRAWIYGTVYATYDYVAVPEPASIFLVGLSMIGLLVARKKYSR
jgi:hypothetical protein